MTSQSNVPVKTNGEHATRGMTRWQDPLDLIDELRQEMSRFWTYFWPMTPSPIRRFAAEQETAWLPSTDVFEKGKEIVVKAELPGVKKDDIEVAVEAGDLIIKGERKSETEVKNGDYYRMERAYGSFYRRLPLPSDIKAEDIKATFTDGVLEVRIPKPAAPKPEVRKIAVS